MDRIRKRIRAQIMVVAVAGAGIVGTGFLTDTAKDSYEWVKEIAFGRTCSIAGEVLDAQNSRPLSGVQIAFEVQEGIKKYRKVKANAATTGPDGTFSAECTGIAASEFPLVISLWRPGWTAHHMTGAMIGYGEIKSGVNLSINVSSLTRRRPIPMAIAPGAVGDVVRVDVVGVSRSYDFRLKRIGLDQKGGDFYFSYGYPAFFANNAGQTGLVDLGPITDQLDTVIPPDSGYHRFGVDAVVGNVYVARAREGHQTGHITFRVLDIGLSAQNSDYYDFNDNAKYYVFQYYYQSN